MPSRRAPSCPRCGVRVYRTHHCRKPADIQFARPHTQPDPDPLVPMPPGWRNQVHEQTHHPDPLPLEGLDP